MRKILEDLYYGRLNIHEKSFQRGGEYNKAADKFLALEKELREIVPADKLSVLDAFSAALSDLNELAKVDDFISGFRIGAQLMAAVFLQDTPLLTMVGEKSEEQS